MNHALTCNGALMLPPVSMERCKCKAFAFIFLEELAFPQFDVVDFIS